MAASYPSSIKTFTSKTDKEDIYEASHINDLQDEVNAIETELGTNVAGSKTNLVDRLAIMMEDNGSANQGTSFPGSPVEGQLFWNNSTKLFYIYDADAAEWKLLSGVPTSYVPGTECILFVPGKGIDDGTSVIDVSASAHTLTANNNAVISTDAYKWGDSSLYFDGTGDYVSAAGHADFDVLANKANDLTISFWAKHTDHVGVEYYLNAFEDANNRWNFYNEHGVGLVFSFIHSGGWQYTITAAEIADTDWHHIAFIRKGAATPDYGIYVDGVQKVHSQDTSEASLATPTLYIGGYNGANNNFDGYMEQIMITNENYYSASPNSSLADTITVPTAEETPTGGGDGQSELIHLSSGGLKRWIKR